MKTIELMFFTQKKSPKWKTSGFLVQLIDTACRFLFTSFLILVVCRAYCVCEFPEMAFVLNVSECSANFLKFTRNTSSLLRRSSIVDLKCSARHYGQSVSGEKTVRIGCASGFWGDTAVSGWPKGS